MWLAQNESLAAVQRSMLRLKSVSASSCEKPAFSKPAKVAWYEQLVPTSAPAEDACRLADKA